MGAPRETVLVPSVAPTGRTHRGLLREAPALKFAFIAAKMAEFPITVLCRMLEVSRAGFYAAVGRSPSAHAVEDQRLAVLVREAHERSRKTYGSPRVHAELAATHQVFVSRKRVVRIMQREGLKARVRKRFKCTTMSDHGQPVAANLDQKFGAERPNQFWAGDTSEFVTGDGKLYLAVILDLFSRYVVGWALSAVNDRHLTLRALDMAVRRRCPEAGLVHHSDRGSPYASEDYQRLLAERGITCSMSRKGNCYDNAPMESWFSTAKFEVGERFTNHGEAKDRLFDYIEVFYNQQRRHSAIGYVSPAEFERAARERQAA
jgi:putative transposase